MQTEPVVKKVHRLKTWPQFYQATLNAKKKFELRRNDRDFKVGDELLLQEWNPEPTQSCVVQGYTGREVLVRVDYIMKAEDAAGILNRPYLVSAEPPDYVIMSVSLIP